MPRAPCRITINQQNGPKLAATLSRSVYLKKPNMTAMTSNIDHTSATDELANFDPSAWSRAVTHIVAIADKMNIRTLGITATQVDAGVSMLARAISNSYVGFGKRTLLAQSIASAQQKANLEQEENGEVRLPVVLTNTAKQPTTVSLSSIIDVDQPQHKARNQLNELTPQFDMIVVDLPPVSTSVGRSTPEFMSFAPLCDLNFLICLTGVTQQGELIDCLEQCSILDVKLGGIIMNDHKILGSKYILT